MTTPDQGHRHELVRSVPGPPGQVRTTLVRALRDAGFTVASEGTTFVEATRGSAVRGAVATERLPVRLEARFTADGAATRLHVQVRDRWPSAVQLRGLDQMYREVFAGVDALVDAAFSAQGALRAPAPERQGGLLDRFGGPAAAAARSALRGADRRLGGDRGGDAPQRWARVVGVEVTVGPAEAERLPRDEVDGVLDAAALVGAQPGGLPAALVGHVERLAARLEEVLDRGEPLPALGLDAQDGPALLFLRQQAALREVLPERRLLVCRDCRLEKLVNEEYQRRAERNRRLSEMVTRVVAPAMVLRQALRIGTSPSDFVCPRCQGLAADSFVVTFCPSCGRQHRDGALRECPCGLDFRAEAVRLLAERPPAVVTLPPDPPPPAGPAGPPPGAPAVLASPAAVVPPAVAPAARPPAPAVRPVASAPLPPAGWYPDPWRAAPMRWWDGRGWTGWVHPPA